MHSQTTMMNNNEIENTLLNEARNKEDEMRLWWRAYYAMRFGALDIAIATLKNIELSYRLNPHWLKVLEELNRKQNND